MEKHFADELSRSNVNAPLSEENREKAYAESARQNGKDEPDLEEMVLVDKNLQHERNMAVQTFYAKQIKDFLEGVMTSN